MSRFGSRSRVNSRTSTWITGATFPVLALGPALWFDASDSSTITASSGAVSQWNDKSGNGYNLTQSTAANQPTTGSKTQNGLNIITFDGVNDRMSCAAGANGQDTVSMFFAGRYISATGEDTAITLGKSAQTNRIRCIYMGSDLWGFATWGPNTFTTNPLGCDRAIFSQFGAVMTSSTAITLYKNGNTTTATLSAATQAINDDTFTVSGIQGSTYEANIDVGEIIVFYKQVAAADAVSLCKYLQAKWSI